MAITVGNTAVSAALAGGTSTTLSLNNNKTDVIVAVAIRDTRTAATVTAAYGGDSMTADITRLRVDGDSTEDLRVYIFRKTGAKTGANNIVITADSAVEYWAVLGIAVGGLAASGQPDTTGGADADHTAEVSSTTDIVTTATNSICVDCLYSKSGNNFTADSGQTIVGQVLVNGGSDRALMGYKIVASGGAKNSSYTEAEHDDWCMVSAAYAFAPSSGSLVGDSVLVGKRVLVGKSSLVG